MAAETKPWRATVLTLFREMFPGPLGVSLAGKALASGLWALEARDIRDSATDRHRSVDDTPAGGGPGMVLRADVLADAIDAGLSGRRPLDEALAAYEQHRNTSEIPYFDLTTQLAALAPPPIELQQVLFALQFNPEQRGRFFGVLAHAVPVQDFFSPENMQKIMASDKKRATAS